MKKIISKITEVEIINDDELVVRFTTPKGNEHTVNVYDRGFIYFLSSSTMECCALEEFERVQDTWTDLKTYMSLDNAKIVLKRLLQKETHTSASIIEIQEEYKDLIDFIRTLDVESETIIINDNTGNTLHVFIVSL